jgi:hypothetical protein
MKDINICNCIYTKSDQAGRNLRMEPGERHVARALKKFKLI